MIFKFRIHDYTMCSINETWLLFYHFNMIYFSESHTIGIVFIIQSSRRFGFYLLIRLIFLIDGSYLI